MKLLQDESGWPERKSTSLLCSPMSSLMTFHRCLKWWILNMVWIDICWLCNVIL